MLRRILLCLFLAILVSPQLHGAEDDPGYRKWMDYFEGKWSVESETGEKEQVVFSYVPGKYAMTGRRKGDSKAAQLIGWRPDRGVMVDTHYSDDGYSVVEYSDLEDPKTLKGKFTAFSTPDGDFPGALVIVKVVDHNTAIVHLTGKNKEGKTLNSKMTYKRQ